MSYHKQPLLVANRALHRRLQKAEGDLAQLVNYIEKRWQAINLPGNPPTKDKVFQMGQIVLQCKERYHGT